MKNRQTRRRITAIAALVLVSVGAFSTASGAQLYTSAFTSTAECTDGTRGDQVGDVFYRSSEGLTIRTLEGGVSLYYAPDTQPGHLSYAIIVSRFSGSGGFFCNLPFSHWAEVNAASPGGAIKSVVISFGEGEAFTNATASDALTFVNMAAEPAQVSVVYKILGVLSASVMRVNYGSGQLLGTSGYNARFAIDQIGTFDAIGRAHADGNSGENYQNFAGNGFSSYEITPAQSGHGAIFVGRFQIPPGQSAIQFTHKLDLFARFGPATSDFKNTSTVQIVVPATVSFTSESGDFLTGITAASRMNHDMTGDFDLPLPLTGSAGVECRDPAVPGEYQVVVKFANPLSSIGSTTVSAGNVASSMLSNGTT